MMCPSSISMRRRIRAATAWSWVITMIVVPCGVELFQQVQQRLRRWRSPGCRSARRPAPPAGGRRSPGRSRPAAAARPTAGSAGRRPGAPARPGPARPPRAAAARRGATPAYSSPSATLSITVWCSARKNCWNTNPIRHARSADSSRSVIRGHVQAGDPHRPAGGPVQGAHQVQQRGLARPGRAGRPRPVPRRPPPGSPGPAPAPAVTPGIPSSPGPAPAPAGAGRSLPATAASGAHVAGTTTCSPGVSAPVTCTRPEVSSKIPTRHRHQPPGVTRRRRPRPRTRPRTGPAAPPPAPPARRCALAVVMYTVTGAWSRAPAADGSVSVTVTGIVASRTGPIPDAPPCRPRRPSPACPPRPAA